MGEALEVAWGFATAERDVAACCRWPRPGWLLALAALALWRCCAGGPAPARRRAGGRADRRSTCARGHGPESRDPARPRPPARDAGASAASARAPARFAGGVPDAGITAAARRTSACATGCTTRAATTTRSSKRYDRLWRARRSRRRRRSSRRRTLAGDAGALRALGLLGVAGSCSSRRPAAAQPLPRSPTRAATRASTRNRCALPRAFLVERQRSSPARTRRCGAVTAPGFDPRATAVVERRCGHAAGSGGAGARSLDLRARARRDRRGAGGGDARALRRLVPRAGRRRSTGATCRSSASTTCCAACASTPARTGRDALPAAELPARLDHQPADRAARWPPWRCAAAAARVRRGRPPPPRSVCAAVRAARLRRAPGCCPGKTLSNSDSFWFKAPWGARAGRPRAPGNPEFDDTPRGLQPFVRHASASCPTCRCGTRTS